MNYRDLLIDSLILKTQAYLHGQISLNHLEIWVLVNIQGILQTEDRAGIDLANLIVSLCTHLEERVIAEEEVSVDLQEYIKRNIEQLQNLPADTYASDLTTTEEYNMESPIDILTIHTISTKAKNRNIKEDFSFAV